MKKYSRGIEMPVNISGSPAQPSDTKLIYSGSGTVTTGASIVNLASFIIPILSGGKVVYIYFDITRTGGVALQYFGCHTTNNTLAAAPMYLNDTSGHNICIVRQDYTIDPTKVSYLTWNDTTLSTDGNKGTFGDPTTSKTIYFNMQQDAATSYQWYLSIYIMGDGVK